MEAITLAAHATSEAHPSYSPMPWSLKEIRAAIPATCFQRNTCRSFLYLFRDLFMAAVLCCLATSIDPFFSSPNINPGLPSWWFQGLVFTGIWVIGHECGHGAFSAHRKINDTIGFVTHSFLWTPYFSWKISHHRHHISHASMERDEVYVPKTRSDLGLPPPGTDFDYEDIFGDTPIYTLFILLRQQLLAFPAYLLFNSSGQKHYPKWTNHFTPSSILFTKGQRRAVIISNLGLFIMVCAVREAVVMYGAKSVIKYYGIPWLAVTHWFIMITYLHHTDPVVPHFRGKQWNFQRGAAATVDRPFLGWQGEFFLHSVARYHVVHHFFPKMPFYHGKEATDALKKFIGPYYTFSEKPVFQALWENYNRCQFVDDQGGIVFYRDKKGDSAVTTGVY
ncbi:fatty acid desaturase-domain-containing protein [Mycena albidolilacea]|uniref:Fatty acid desaturase-domain-containing protein n=1 Tax=Mycena albidolilacea TaxID=1033008 RepID=A0AAD6ZSF5_9AGAR|nr:fatty acid desaturase-domain-containing protein [Mycena albidolilacea]